MILKITVTRIILIAKNKILLEQKDHISVIQHFDSYMRTYNLYTIYSFRVKYQYFAQHFRCGEQLYMYVVILIDEND